MLNACYKTDISFLLLHIGDHRIQIAYNKHKVGASPYTVPVRPAKFNATTHLPEVIPVEEDIRGDVCMFCSLLKDS